MSAATAATAVPQHDAPSNAQHDAMERFVARQFQDLLRNPLFPCTIARGAAAQDHVTVRLYDDMEDPHTAARLLDDLYRFVAEHPLGEPGSGPGFHTFAAAFARPAATDEARFEALLWTLLQRLHDLDRPLHAWDPTVADDPASPHFSFSLGGRAFFIVGVHPGASRLARRFAYPTVVFNAHAQFEGLRARGAYDAVRDKIRGNDRALQGSINPTLRDHGSESEVRQYSGRETDSAWRCPFHAGGRAGDADGGGA